MPLILVLILAMPVLEIAAFVIVGSRIGVLATIGLVLLSAVLGAILLRVQGIGILQRLRRESEAGRVPQREIVHGAMVMVAGFLLLLPGFITDVLGLLLFVPVVRDLIWRLIAPRIVFAGGARFGGGFARREDARTIDLDSGDFSRTSGQGPQSPGSPWKRPTPRD